MKANQKTKKPWEAEARKCGGKNQGTGRSRYLDSGLGSAIAIRPWVSVFVSCGCCNK